MYKYTVITCFQLVKLFKITTPHINIEKYTFIVFVFDSIKVFPVYRQEDFFIGLRVSSVMYKIQLNN